MKSNSFFFLIVFSFLSFVANATDANCKTVEISTLWPTYSIAYNRIRTADCNSLIETAKKYAEERCLRFASNCRYSNYKAKIEFDACHITTTFLGDIPSKCNLKDIADEESFGDFDYYLDCEQ